MKAPIVLPNRARLHRLASSFARATDLDNTCINIEGPDKGAYTSYRMTPAGRRAVLAASRRPDRRVTHRNRKPEPFLFDDGPRESKRPRNKPRADHPWRQYRDPQKRKHDVK